MLYKVMYTTSGVSIDLDFEYAKWKIINENTWI